MLGVVDRWAAFCLDECVAVWGNWVEGKMSERTNVGMPRHSLDNLLEGKLGRSMKATVKALSRM